VKPLVGFGPERFGYAPSKPTGKAVPAGPLEPVPERAPAIALGKVRDPRTAVNMADKADALAPKRWKPS